MGKEQEVYVEQYNDLPILKINITSASNDFVTHNINIESKGFNMDECKEGIRYLIENLNKIREDKK